MQSFEDLGVTPEIAEALAAEGIEVPTPLQSAAIPVIRKGNNIVLEAGPGSGLLISWVAGLLDRIEPTGSAARALVVCATAETADRLAESTAGLAAGLEHRVAALGSSWALADRADILFASADDALRALETGEIAPAGLEAVVLDQVQIVQAVSGLQVYERIFEFLPAAAQRILTALPSTPEITDLASRHLKRSVTLPAAEAGAPSRGEVRFRIVAEPRETGALSVVEDVLEEGARHVLVYCRTEDRAADVGDYLTLHGFPAGAPGDTSVPVWLGVDALEARAAAADVEGVVVVSWDAPADPDSLDRRHSLGTDGTVVVLPREIPHVKSLGRRTGYKTVPFPPGTQTRDPLRDLRSMISTAIEAEDTAPYLAAIEPLLERHDAAEVAAAAVALLRKKLPEAPTPTPQEGPFRRETRASAPPGRAVPSWAKLFLSVGERDGLAKGDLLGAITGEAGVPGEAVGRIDIRDTHTIVEVHDTVAQAVIRALNGTTIKGRSVRADFDRPRARGPSRSRPRP
jgi:ATP-dependent RNA helicase DeaD